MTAFNAVRFRVKPGQDQAFLDAHKKIAGDWPGLRPADLHQGRDLRPTTDLRQLMLATGPAHLGVDPARAARTLFPGPPVRPLDGVLRS